MVSFQRHDSPVKATVQVCFVNEGRETTRFKKIRPKKNEAAGKLKYSCIRAISSSWHAICHICKILDKFFYLIWGKHFLLGGYPQLNLQKNIKSS